MSSFSVTVFFVRHLERPSGRRDLKVYCLLRQGVRFLPPVEVSEHPKGYKLRETPNDMMAIKITFSLCLCAIQLSADSSPFFLFTFALNL
jgi:hypothetical protein